jgi:hypothetical protein
MSETGGGGLVHRLRQLLRVANPVIPLLRFDESGITTRNSSRDERVRGGIVHVAHLTSHIGVAQWGVWDAYVA